LTHHKRIQLLSTLIYYDHEKILYYEASLNDEIFIELETYLSEENLEDIDLISDFYHKKYKKFRLNQIIQFPKGPLLRDFVIIFDRDIASIISNDLKCLFNYISKTATDGK